MNIMEALSFVKVVVNWIFKFFGYKVVPINSVEERQVNFNYPAETVHCLEMTDKGYKFLWNKKYKDKYLRYEHTDDNKKIIYRLETGELLWITREPIDLNE